MKPSPPRRGVLRLVLSFAAAAVACEGGASPDPDTRAVPSSRVALPGRCAVAEVVERLESLTRGISSGDGAAVAAQFEAGEGLWEVYDHMNPPNGTAGGLDSPRAVLAFADEVHRRGEVWTYVDLAPPVGTAGLPDSAGFGFSITVAAGGATRTDGGKVAVDCGSGLISHMVGPHAA